MNEVTEPPRGTSKEYALRRLRKEAPELHAEVLAERMSAHATMVQAGLERPRFTVVVSSADAVAKAFREKLPKELLAEVVYKLSA